MKRAPRRVKPNRRTAAMVIGDGLLLALALTGLFLFQFNVYGLPGSPLVVLRACLVSAVLFLIVFSLPKYRWAVALGLIVLGLAWLWRYWDIVFQGAQAVYSTIAHVITEATDFPGEFPIPAVWTQNEIRAASNRFLTAVIFALALPLGWAVVRRRAFLPVLMLTLPWLVPIFLAEFPPDVISLSMLAACWIALLLAGLTNRRDPEGGARLALAVLPAALLALCCVCLIFPAEGYTYPDWASGTAQRFIALAEDIQVRLGGGGADATVDLARSGPKQYTGRSVLKVESDWTGRIYLRGAAYADYTGESWERLDDEVQAELEAMAVSTPKSRQAEQVYSATITHLDGVTRMAYYLYQPVDLLENLSGAGYVADSYLRLEEPRKEYTVEFFDPNSDYLLINDGEYSEFVHEHYMDVPEELGGVLLEWWREQDPQIHYSVALQATVPAQIVIAQLIADVLAQNTQYDLQTPVTPKGEDFVAYFLTESHRGYCVHYASAAVLLLRMCGIPARYVSGYTVEMADGEATIPDSAAHAWVEVYREGYGWYPVEVTPAAAFGDDAAGEGSTDNTAPTAEPTPAAEPSDVPVQPTPEPSNDPVQVEQAHGAVDPWSVCCVAAVLVIIGLPVLYRALRRRRWNRLAVLPDHNRAVLDAYCWYQKLIPWGGEPDDQLEDLARKAMFSQHTLTGEERREVLDILSREITRLSARQPVWRRPVFWYLFVWK